MVHKLKTLEKLFCHPNEKAWARSVIFVPGIEAHYLTNGRPKQFEYNTSMVSIGALVHEGVQDLNNARCGRVSPRSLL
jgi:hypothetical protein